jgi:hypothetical protein
MRRSKIAALVFALALLGGGVLAAQAATHVTPLRPAAATLPAQLRALEQKLEQLHINSERFTETSKGFVLGSPNHSSSGKPEHLLRTSVDSTTQGEASVSPAEGEVSVGVTHEPSLIAIGSTQYRYEPEGKGSSRRRPWVRYHQPGESPATQVLPYYGGGPLEVDAGGKGSFANLINQLTTAVGQVSVSGAVSVRGQQTTEFTATIEPRRLIKHLTVEDVRQFNSEPPIGRLQVFLTEAGLPVRIVASTRTSDEAITTTTEVLAVNVPVSVTPPPSSQTRAQK